MNDDDDNEEIRDVIMEDDFEEDEDPLGAAFLYELIGHRVDISTIKELIDTIDRITMDTSKNS